MQGSGFRELETDNFSNSARGLEELCGKVEAIHAVWVPLLEIMRAIFEKLKG